MDANSASLPTQKTKTLLCKQGAVRSIRFNSDGEYCLTSGSDKTVKLWNPHKALLLQTYSGHSSEVLDARGSHDSSLLASGSVDKCIFIWDVTTGQAVKRLRGHVGQVNCIAFNADSSVILSGSVDGTVKAWDCKSKSRDAIQTMGDAKDSITAVSTSDHEIVTSSLDSKIRKYDLRKGLLDVDDVSVSVSHVSMSKDGQCLLAACLNGSLKLLDKDTGEILNIYKGHANKKYRIDAGFVSNDSHVVSGSEDGKLYFWDLIKCTVQATIVHANHRVVHSVNVHPTKNEILTAAEGTAYLWTTETDSDE